MAGFMVCKKITTSKSCPRSLTSTRVVNGEIYNRQKGNESFPGDSWSSHIAFEPGDKDNGSGKHPVHPSLPSTAPCSLVQRASVMQLNNTSRTRRSALKSRNLCCARFARQTWGQSGIFVQERSKCDLMLRYHVRLFVPGCLIDGHCMYESIFVLAVK